MVPGGIDLVPHNLPAGVEVWRVDLDRYRYDAIADVLSADEQARAGRFRFAEHRRRFVAAHHALRHVLGITVSCDPASLVFAQGDHGKPLLALAPSLHFNLSHSGRECLIGTSARQPIGVDVEIVRPVADADALSRRHFTAGERAQWQEAPAARRDEVFLRGWTRKEACLKATGLGLSVAPGSIDAGCEPGNRAAVLHGASGQTSIEVVSFDLGGTAIAAVALAC